MIITSYFRTLALIFLFIVFFGALILTIRTRSVDAVLCITNETGVPVVTSVESITEHDWNSDSRPDKNFNHVTVNQGQKICQKETVNYYYAAKSTGIHFSIHLVEEQTNTDLGSSKISFTALKKRGTWQASKGALDNQKMATYNSNFIVRPATLKH